MGSRDVRNRYRMASLSCMRRMTRTPAEGTKIVPARARSSAFAVIVGIAFVLICVVVLLGYRLGLREPTPLEKAAENITTQPPH